MTKQMFQPIARSRRQRRGLTIFWLIVFFLLLLVFAAFGVEMAWLRVQHTRAHLAAEASALAAAGTLTSGRPSAAHNAAEIAAANVGVTDTVILVAHPDNDGGDLRFGRWRGTNASFHEALLAPDAVEVTIRFREDHPNGPVPLMFGSFVGADSANVTARATAQARPREPVPAALIVLDQFAAGTLALTRGAHVESNGRVGVRSESPDALELRSDSLLSAPLVTVEGGVHTDSDQSIFGMLRVRTKIGTVPAYLPLPLDSLPTHPKINVQMGAVHLDPGYYPDGLIASEGDYRMRGGIYLFGGPGIVLNRKASMASEEAIVVLDKGANLSLDASQVHLVGPDSSGTGTPLSAWAGLALASAEDANPLISLTRQAQLHSTGDLYLPKGELEMDDAHLHASRIVVDSLDATNKATIEVGGPDPHPIDVFIVD